MVSADTKRRIQVKAYYTENDKRPKRRCFRPGRRRSFRPPVPRPGPQVLPALERHADHQLREAHEAALRPDLAERRAVNARVRAPDLDRVGQVQHFEADLAANLAVAKADALAGDEVPVV